MWTDAVEGRSDYLPIDVHWSEVPGRDKKWKDQTIRNTSEDQFRIEFETEFIGSTNTLISPSKLTKLVYKNPIASKDGYDVWEKAQDGRSYFMACDVARGAGKDFSAFSVIDITDTPYRMVARYMNNQISPLLYPTVIAKVAQDYNEAHVLLEVNDIGGQVADTLHYDLEYENILTSTTKGRSGQVLSAGFSRGTDLGIKTTAQVKRIGCRVLKNLIEEDQLLIPDLMAIAELSCFAIKGKSYAATEGAHDDIVMSLVLFAWVANQRYFKDLMDQDLRLQMYQERMREIEEDLTPFGFIESGLENEIIVDDSGQSWNVVKDHGYG
jgi:hypothetical protein